MTTATPRAFLSPSILRPSLSFSAATIALLSFVAPARAGSCVRDADCGAGMYCDAHDQCQSSARCVSDADCGAGKYCDAHDQCESVSAEAASPRSDAPVAPPRRPCPAPREGIAPPPPEQAPREFHVGPMLYTSVGVGYAHYGETDTGPAPGSFTLDGVGFALPVGIYGVQITRGFALGLAAAFHPFYAVGGSFAAGGFGGLGLVFSPTPTFDVDAIVGAGGTGVSGVFGGGGPAASVGATFYVAKAGALSVGPVARLSVQGVFGTYPGGNSVSAILFSPTLGFAGTIR